MQLAGKRLTLRDIETKDRPSLIHWLQPDHEWHKTNGPYYPKAQAEEIPGIVDNWLTADLPDLRQRMLIVNNETDQLIGMVNRYWISKETHWPALGIMLFDSAVWGKGLGYEALGLWCEYLLETNPLFVRLDLRTWSGNIGMIKLAEKLGFMREATFRKARIVEGAYYDGLGYGILRDEWETRYADGFAESLN
jgi:RimJ/RimL family protein N-acetyltransferase